MRLKALMVQVPGHRPVTCVRMLTAGSLRFLDHASHTILKSGVDREWQRLGNAD
jgi:hypothetical protein